MTTARNNATLLRLPDEVLARIVAHIGEDLVFQDRKRCPLLAASQVCRRIRRIVHTRVATRLHIRQPRLTPCRLLALANLSCGSFTAATSLDLSCCLDWVQHPSLTTLVDLRAITVMTQLRELKLRPSYDAIDSFEGDRVKLKSGVLCWADGIMMRLWDRWMYALSPGIPTILHKTALAALSQLETLHFPITVRVTEDPHQRTQSVLSLPHLRSLALGGAALVDADVATLASASTLTYLSIGECAGLTDVGLRTLGGMSHLCVLLLHGCARMGVHDRWAALRRLSVLHTLALYGRREGENVHFRHLVDPAPQCVPIGCEGFAAICSMTHLEALRIGGCESLQGHSGGLTPLLDLTGLTTLELSGGSANAAIIAAIACTLTRLQQVALRNMRVCGVAMQDLGMLPRLQTLSLDRCGDPPRQGWTHTAASGMGGALSGLSQLQQLLLWDRNADFLHCVEWSVFAQMTLLSRLTLSCCVNDERVEHLTVLQRLHTLELRQTDQLTNMSMHAVAQLPELVNIDLVDCPNVDDDGLESLTRYRQLLTFRMKGSRITDRSVRAMTAGWPQLRNLSLARTPGITIVAMGALAEASDLKILDVGGCSGITDDGLVALTGRQLRQLNLERCPRVSNPGVEAFKQKLLAAGPPPPAGTKLQSCVVVFF